MTLSSQLEKVMGDTDKTAKPKYLVFIPVHQGAKTIGRVMLKLAKLPMEFDVLVVDNNSQDSTLEVVKSVIKEHNLKGYHLIRNIANLGYGGSQKVALFFGIYNGYDRLMIIHADDQYPVEYIPKLVEFHSQRNAAMSLGTRLKHPDIKKVMPMWRFVINSTVSAMNNWVYGLKLDEWNSEFRLYDLKFMKDVDIDACGNSSNYTLDSLLAIKLKGGLIDQMMIPCAYPPDAHHPAFWDSLFYGFHNGFRAMKYVFFKR